MTQLGLGSYGVWWAIGVPGYAQPSAPLDHFGLIEITHRLGLKLVQIADNLPLHTLDSQARAQLRALAHERHVAIEVGTRGIALDHLHHYLEIAQYFDSSILRVVVDTSDHHPAPNEVVTLLKAALPALRQAGITLAIENHDRFKAKTLAEIVERIDDPHVGICLDTVNSFGALEGPESVVGALGPHVVNLHLKEFVVRRAAHNMGFEITGVPAGQGMLDIPWLLEALQKQGRTFNALIETWLPPEPTPQATIEKEADWVKQSVAYLRTLIKD